jgi:hypothetical protein
MATEKKVTPEPVHERAIPVLSRAPSEEEVARRTRVVSELLKLRSSIGPVKMTMAELLAHREDQGADE